jgi:hypothetical protein
MELSTRLAKLGCIERFSFDRIAELRGWTKLVVRLPESASSSTTAPARRLNFNNRESLQIRPLGMAIAIINISNEGSLNSSNPNETRQKILGNKRMKDSALLFKLHAGGISQSCKR